MLERWAALGILIAGALAVAAWHAPLDEPPEPAEPAEPSPQPPREEGADLEEPEPNDSDGKERGGGPKKPSGKKRGALDIVEDLVGF